MSPITHLLIGWLVSSGLPSRRDRVVVSVAGVIPDVDGAGIVAQLLTARTESPLMWFSDYHHVLCHNLGFCLLYSGMAYLLSRKGRVAGLALISLHAHLLGDLVGSRGPDGYQWPIPYLLPFSDSWQWTWRYQWELNAWPNFLITGICLCWIFWLARLKGYSPVEVFSARADQVFINALRKRFPVRR